MSLRWEVVDGSGSTTKPYVGSCPHSVIAASISAGSRRGAVTTSTADFEAADVAQVASRRLPGLSGLKTMAMRATLGAISLSSCSQAWFQNQEAGQISAWVCQALHQAFCNGVAARDKVDGNRTSRLLHDPRCGV